MIKMPKLSHYSKQSESCQYSQRSKSIYESATQRLSNDPLKQYFQQQKESIISNERLTNQIQKLLDMGLLRQKKEFNKKYAFKQSIVRTDCLQKSNKSQARGVGGSIYTS